MAPDTQSIDFNANFLTLGLAHLLPLDNAADFFELAGTEILSAAIKRVDDDEDEDDEDEDDEDEDDEEGEYEDDGEEDDEEYEDDEEEDDEDDDLDDEEEEDDEELNLI